MSQMIDLPQARDEAAQGILLRRFFALITDGVILTCISLAAGLFITIFGFLTLGFGWLAFHILPWLPLVYYTLLIGARGATPGQRALGLCVRQDADFSRPTMAQAAVWAILLWVSFVLACLPFALALLGPRHRAAHDLLSGLVVIRDR